MDSSIPELQLKLGLFQNKQVFMLHVILETKQNLAAVFVWLLSGGQKRFFISDETFYCDLSGGSFIIRVGNNNKFPALLWSSMETLSASVLVMYSHAVVLIQKQKCSLGAAVFHVSSNILAFEDCCSHTQCTLIGLNFGITQVLRQSGMLRISSFLTLSTTGYNKGFVSCKFQ